MRPAKELYKRLCTGKPLTLLQDAGVIYSQILAVTPTVFFADDANRTSPLKPGHLALQSSALNSYPQAMLQPGTQERQKLRPGHSTPPLSGSPPSGPPK